MDRPPAAGVRSEAALRSDFGAMSLPAQYAAQLVAFPSVLRELVEAELAAGNTIVEVASCFPAPPAGAYVKLAKSITTRPRAKTAALDFYDRNTSIYSGEWTDARRFYFVIEPPQPPPAEVDMNAIRDARSPNAGTRQHSENKSSRSAAGLSAPDSPVAPSS